MERNFHIKNRPTDFDQIIGNENVVDKLRSYFNKGIEVPKCIILHSKLVGVGKTTSALILADRILDGQSPIQIDCGALGDNKNPAADLRELVKEWQHKPVHLLNIVQRRVVILDELQALTSTSQSVLNSITEDAEQCQTWLYFIFTTTNISKISDAIKSRSVKFEFKRVDNETMLQFLIDTCNKDNIKASVDALSRIVSVSGGSPRNALTILDSNVVNNEVIIDSDVSDNDISGNEETSTNDPIMIFVNILCDEKNVSYTTGERVVFSKEQVLSMAGKLIHEQNAITILSVLQAVALKRFNPSNTSKSTKRLLSGDSATHKRLTTIIELCATIDLNQNGSAYSEGVNKAKLLTLINTVLYN